jgi:hypothetical protein
VAVHFDDPARDLDLDPVPVLRDDGVGSLSTLVVRSARLSRLSGETRVRYTSQAASKTASRPTLTIAS